MTPEAAAALINLGVAGVGLYLFAVGRLRSSKVDEERAAADAATLAEVVRLYDIRIAEGDARYEEMRTDRNQWRDLALGTERRLDAALPTVATAIGAAVPSAKPTTEAGP